MSRTISEVALNNKSVEEVIEIIEKVLIENKYSNKIVKGENIWIKGDGVISIMLCFAYNFTESYVIIQGWANDMILGESELKGFFGGLPKKKAKSMMEQIERKILL